MFEPAHNAIFKQNYSLDLKWPILLVLAQRQFRFSRFPTKNIL